MCVDTIKLEKQDRNLKFISVYGPTLKVSERKILWGPQQYS